MSSFWAGFFGMLLGSFLWTLAVAIIKGVIAGVKAWRNE